MRLHLLAAATLLTGTLFAADPELLSLAPPDTQVMAGINVEQVALSPLGQYLLRQSQQQADAGLQKLAETTGFDPRRDLREILVAGNGQPAGHSGIILARGTFDLAKIVEAAVADGATVETYKGVQIIHQKSKQDQTLALPDSTLAIAGDAANVRAAIDRKSAPTAISSTLAVAVNLASTTEDAWFVSMVPPSQLQPHASTAGAQDPMAILNKVQQASGGVKFGANVVVTLKAVSATAQDASTLAEALKSLIGLAGMAAPDAQSAAAALALLKSVNISADGTATNISLSIPEQQIEEMFQSVHGAAGSSGHHTRHTSK